MYREMGMTYWLEQAEVEFREAWPSPSCGQYGPRTARPCSSTRRPMTLHHECLYW